MEAAIAGAPAVAEMAAAAPASPLTLSSIIDPKNLQAAVDAQLKLLADNPAAAQQFLQTTAASAGLVEGVAASETDVAAANQKVLATAPRLSGALQTINQEMKFPNPSDGPAPEVLVSKVEDKIQERAPLVANKALKLANDAYTHVDFNRLVDRMLSLKQDGAALGHWPGPNPYGFAPDDDNFCIFAVPILKNAPNVFKAAAAGSPLGLPAGVAGPQGEVFSKLPADAKPTLPTTAGAKAAFAALASKFGALASGAGAAAAGAAPGGKLPTFNPDGLKSVAMGGSLALDQEASIGKASMTASDVPEVRTYSAEGKEWACTPFDAGARGPTALALAAGVAAPAPATRRSLLAEDPTIAAMAAAADPTAEPAAATMGAPTKPSMDDTINPAGAKIVDPAALLGAPAGGEPQLTNPITGENKFANSEELSDAVAEESAGAYNRLMERVQSGAADEEDFGREALADMGDRVALQQFNSFASIAGLNASLVAGLAAKNATFMAALAAKNSTLAAVLASKNATLAAAYGGGEGLVDAVRASLANKNATLRDMLKKPDPKRPPLITFDPATGTARVHPPKSAIDALGVRFDQVVRGETGNPFFDCVGVKDAPSGKEWVATAASDAEKLTAHLVSFLKASSGKGTPVPTGFTVKNPFDAAAAPVNVQFSQASPFLKVPGGEKLGDNPWAAAKAFIDAAPKPPRPARRGDAPAGAPPSDAARAAAAGTPAASSANFGGHDWQEEAAKMAADAEAAREAAHAAARAADAASAAAKMLPVGADGSPTLMGVAYDGYVSDCALVVGSPPRADGTFDKVDGFLTTVKGGRFGVPAAILADHPGAVAYVIPAARGKQYASVSAPGDSPGHCFDRATLLPSFNPLATPLPTTPDAVARGPAASPLSSLLVFGGAAGMTQAHLTSAFGLDPSIDVATHDALASALAEANPDGPAMTAARADAAVANTVTMAAALLAGDTPAYANAAVLAYGAVAEAAVAAAKAAGVEEAPAVAAAPAAADAASPEEEEEEAPAAAAPAPALARGGRRLAQADAAGPPRREGPPQGPPQRRAPPALPTLRLPGAADTAAAPAAEPEADAAAAPAAANPVKGATLNLADAAVVASIFARAQAMAAANPAGAPPPVDPAVAAAAAGAVASLNAEAGAARNPADAQKTMYVAQAQLVPAVGRLAAGTVPATAFAAAASPDGVRASLASASLPGVLDAAPLGGAPKKGGLSKGGAVAVGVLVPAVLLAAAGGAAFALSRRRGRAPMGAVRG
jgi:hypothetical protein